MGDILTGIRYQSPGVLTSRVAPDFDPDKASILAASKATSLLMIEGVDSRGHRSLHFATAFFIAPSVLLTAGHAALEAAGAVRTDFYIFHPGTQYLDWNQVWRRTPSAIRCTVVQNLYSGGRSSSKDIAILSSGSFESAHFLPLSGDRIPVHRNVDVIGYPGEKRNLWLTEKHEGLNNVEESGAAGEVLLPTRQLVVTRGVVAYDAEDLTSYTISTCPGLSGACVMFNGKVHGITLVCI